MNDVHLEKTSDGLDAARVGDVVYAMAAARDGSFRVLSAWTAVPVADLKQSSFMGSGDGVDGVEGFKSHLAEMQEHYRQVKSLGRHEEPSTARTPWGTSQGATVYQDKGIYGHSTAGHGGFKVFARFNCEIPDAYRNADGWYEEDCEYAKVVVSLPAFFTDREVRKATEAVRNWFPDEYEAVTGEVIPEGRSFKKDERLFKERNAENWIVISASSMDREGAKMVHCHASKGGERSGWDGKKDVEVETAQFLVSSDEYAKRSSHGFVIDPERHERLDAPAAVPGI